MRPVGFFMSGKRLKHAYEDGLAAYQEREYTRAAALFEKAAQIGNVDAMRWLAKMYERGLGLKESRQERFRWYLKAALYGHVESMVIVAQAFDLGDGTARNEEKGLFWWLQAAKQNQKDAALEMGKRCLDGRGIQADAVLACYWLEKAVQMGIQSASKLLERVQTMPPARMEGPEMLETADLIWTDPTPQAMGLTWDEICCQCTEQQLKQLPSARTKAETLLIRFEERFGRGDTNAEQELTCVDEETIFGLRLLVWNLVLLARQGEARAAWMLHECFLMGVGVEQAYSAALYWGCRAAQLGQSALCGRIGFMYQQGIGTDVNERLAKMWNLKGANYGISEAELGLAHLYEKGCGVKKDLTHAFFWYWAAGQSGDKRIAKEVAIRFRRGIGVEADIAAAMAWNERIYR